MKIVIEIVIDNAAFEQCPQREIQRILREFVTEGFGRTETGDHYMASYFERELDRMLDFELLDQGSQISRLPRGKTFMHKLRDVNGNSVGGVYGQY